MARSRPIKLARSGVDLPVDAATQTFLIVGKRGSGKSNTAVVLAEKFFQNGVPFVAIDPVDTWWGLKASRNGNGPGLGVYVFGGKHADLPLEPTAGALIADTLIEHRISAVLSVKHLSGRERTRFVTDFAKRLFQKNTEPLHVFMEEAHELAPQQPMKGEEEMLGAINRLWKLGRSSGIGGTAVTQRPASLSKNITTQAEILIVHRTIGPQDVDAIRAWIRYHGENEAALKALSSLTTGHALVWAPDFPEDAPLGLREAEVLLRDTYDSSATPKAGQRRAEPKRLAEVDLEQLRAQMAETIERAKADDPRALRQRIAELERSLATERAKPTAVPAKRVEVKVPVISEKLVARVEKAIEQLRLVSERTSTVAITVGSAVAAAKDLTRAAQRVVGGGRQPEAEQEFTPAMARAIAFKDEKEPRRPALIRDASSSADVTRMGKAFLTILAQHPRGLTKSQMLTYTGYAASGPVSKEFASLGRMGWVESLDRSTLRITDAGLEALGPFDPLPTGDRLRELRLSEAAPMERKFLELAFASYPNAVSKGDMLRQTGYAASGPVSKAFARLVRLGWLKAQGRGMLLAADEFFSA